MFPLDESQQRARQTNVGGVKPTSFAEVYDTQHQADTLGGQSWSYHSQVEPYVLDTYEALKGAYGVKPFLPFEAIRNRVDNKNAIVEDEPGFLNMWQGRTVARYTGAMVPADTPENSLEADRFRNERKTISQMDSEWNDLVDRARKEHPELASKLWRTDELVRNSISRANDAQAVADEVASRASGGAQFWGGSAAGVVQAAREPVNIAATLATMGTGSLIAGASIGTRVALTAAIEGAVNAGAEGAVQSQLYGSYLTRGMTEEQAKDKALTAVAMAGAGGAAFGALGEAAGSLLKGASKGAKELDGLGNITHVRNQIKAIEESGAPLSATEKVALKTMKDAVEIVDAMPASIARTPENLRAAAIRLDVVNKAITSDKWDEASLTALYHLADQTENVGSAYVSLAARIQNGEPVDMAELSKVLLKDDFEELQQVISKNLDDANAVDGPRQLAPDEMQRVISEAEQQADLAVPAGREDPAWATVKDQHVAEITQKLESTPAPVDPVALTRDTAAQFIASKAARSLSEAQGAKAASAAGENATPALTPRERAQQALAATGEEQERVLAAATESAKRAIAVTQNDLEDALYREAQDIMAKLELDPNMDPQLLADMKAMFDEADDEILNLEMMAACIIGG